MHRIDDRDRLRELKTITPQAPVKKADQDAYEEPFREYGIKRERRVVHEQLRSALLQGYETPDDLEDALANEGSAILHLPPSGSHEKRGKGTAYDRARSSQWQKSARTHQRRGSDKIFIPQRPQKPVPQVKRQIAAYKAKMQAVFKGQLLPSKKRLVEKELLGRVARLEERMDASQAGSELKGAEKHAVLMGIGDLHRRITGLWEGLQPYKDTAYGIYRNTRIQLGKIRRRASQRAGISPKAKRNRRTKSGKMSNIERSMWKDQNENLGTYASAQGYDE